MFKGLRTLFAKADPAPAVMGEMAYSETNIRLWKGEKYNPDDLIGIKGHSIYSKMMMDEQVKAVARFRRDAITSRNYQFVYEGDVLSPEEAAARTKLLEAILRKMRGSFTDCMNGIMSAEYNGFSITEKVFAPIEVQGKTWMGLKRLAIKPFNTFRFKTDDFGNVEEIKQVVGQRSISIDPAKLIHFVQNPDEDEHYGQSELRSAYRAWFSKTIILKFYNIHLERHASGFLVIKPQQGVLRAGTAEWTALTDMLNNINASTGMILPSGMTVTHTMPATTNAYIDAIAMFDKAIAKALLVPNLLGITEQGQTGSYSQSQTQMEAFMMTLDADAYRLEECLNEQLFDQLGDMNWGDGEYPQFRFMPSDDGDKQAIMTTWKDLLQAKAVQPGANDEAFIREQLEFPEYEEPTAPANEPPASDQQPPAPAPSPDQQPPAMDGPKTPPAAFTKAVSRVEFAVIDKSSRDIEARYSAEIATATKDMVEQLMLEASLDPAEVAKLAVPIANKERLKRSVKRMLKDGWALGTKHATNELAKVDMAAGDPLGALAASFFDAKAFSIAGSITDRIAGMVQQLLFNGIKNSNTMEEIQASITEALTAEGVYLDTHMIDTIVRTNTFEAINEARFDYFRDPALGSFVEGFEYSAIMDDRTTQICQHLDGKSYAADSDVWAQYRPPNHYNCRSILIPITAADTWAESAPPTIKPQAGFK